MKRTLWLLILLLALTVTGCRDTSTTSRELFAMDTVMNLTVYQPRAESLLNQAEQEIRRLEALLSVTDPGSEIAAVNRRSATTVTVSQETADLLRLCLGFSEETHGLFDITVYPAVKAWGFTQDTHTVPSEEALAQLVTQIGYEKMAVTDSTVTLPQGMAVDMGGIAKGYAADRIAALWKEAGCTGGILSLGGNVLTVGEKPDGSLFQIAIQDPADAGGMLATLSLPGNTAVVTSGDYQRYFEQDGKRYHHIIDPRTAAPAENSLTSVTVITSCAARGDALATALFVMGLEEGLNYVNQTAGVEAVFVTKQSRVYYTTGLAEGLTPESQQYTFTQKN